MGEDKRPDDNDIARAIIIAGEQISAGLFAVAKSIEDLKPSPADKLVLTYTKRGQ